MAMADTVPSELAGFDPAGASEYEKQSREYRKALEQVSRAIAKQRNSDSVIPFHVQLAVESLGKDSGQKFKRLNELGALLIGASLANLGVIIFGSAYTFKSALLVFIPLLPGCILYAYTWRRG
jgi:hypothetical protein